MRMNAMKAKWRAGETTYGAWLSTANPIGAEAMAQVGFDWICIDMQHGLIDYQAALGMLQAISTTDTTPIARVPWNEPGIIGKMLDAGAMGIIIPMVNSVEEAEAATRACRYAPQGARSFGPARAMLYAGSYYYQHANDEIACIPMIETKTAIDSLDAILDVAGIDAVYIGPADLSVTYGLAPGVDNDAPEFTSALEAVVAGCDARGIVPGIHSNSSVGSKRAAGGFRMITVSTDLGAIAAGARRDLATVRDADRAGDGSSDPNRVY